MANLKFILLLFLLSLVSCVEDTEPTLGNNINNCNITYAIQADEILNLKDDYQEQIDGLFLKLNSGIANIRLININNQKFEPISDEFELPILHYIIKDNQGKSKIESDINCLDIPVNLDFVYFSWDEIELISQYSTLIYISKLNFNYGETIFPNEVDINNIYFSYKIEGDFTKDNNTIHSPLPIPKYFIAPPCPPIWKPGIQ